MDIGTVAIYTHVDRKAPHVRYADEAYCISENPNDTTYLKEDRIIDIAKKTKAAIHPGYGFTQKMAISHNIALMLELFLLGHYLNI